MLFPIFLLAAAANRRQVQVGLIFVIKKVESFRAHTLRTPALSLDWSVLDLIRSVTDGEKFLVKRFPWKAETVLFEDEAGDKKIMLQLFLMFRMSIIYRLDINCAVTCGCSTRSTMLFSHPKRTSAWCCRVPSGTLVLLDISFNMSALTRSLTSSFFLLHPPCMLSTLFQMHSVPAVLLLLWIVLCHLYLYYLALPREKSPWLCMTLFMCVCVIILLLCSCDVLRCCQLTT